MDQSQGVEFCSKQLMPMKMKRWKWNWLKDKFISSGTVAMTFHNFTTAGSLFLFILVGYLHTQTKFFSSGFILRQDLSYSGDHVAVWPLLFVWNMQMSSQGW